MVQWLAMLQLLWMQQLLLLGAHPGSAQDLTLTPEPALEWLDKGIFIIQSESLKTCIQAGRSVLTLEDCKQPNKYMLWKWVSNSHLFNVGGSGCLGLNLSNPEEPLSLYECDSTLISLRWHCNRKMIIGPLQYKVQVQHGNMVVASWKQTHKWITYMSDGEDICEHLHRDLYTVKGNAHGMPCVFPFQYNQQWHHECTREGRKENLLWCATTSRYERDEKWGFCPDPTSTEVFCDAVWHKDFNSRVCYQFNLLSSLSWNEAHSSCQMQGGSLLSITDEGEENFIRRPSIQTKLRFCSFDKENNHIDTQYYREQLSREAVEVWIGLNQLDEKAGWQWSDGTALNYLNWSPEISDRPFVEYHCGTLKPPSTAWRSRDCESALPYICKRSLNYTAHETLENDSWTYHATHCDPDWTPFNRNCYKLQKEERTWQEALYSCQTNDSVLMDVTSLAELEFLIDLLGDGNASETWIGLSSNRTPVSFRWSTGSSVIFTNWQPLEPRIFPKRSQLCVSAEQAEGLWKVKDCQETLSYVCKRAGQVLDDDESECPEGWERHGKFCYKIDTVLRNFEEASNGYHCHPALLTVTSRFEQAFINNFISSVAKTKDSYFWIALQDENNTGEYTWKTAGQRAEPMQYTHWNTHQPSYSGGCVVMRGGSPLGRWEVKDCSNFKAMSLCKMPVKTWDKTELERRWPFRKCYADWESKSGLASCFKVAILHIRGKSSSPSIRHTQDEDRQYSPEYCGADVAGSTSGFTLVFHSEKVLMKRSWREAEFFCEEFGAQLASFAHTEEEEFVNELLHSKFNRTEERQFWIGFNKRNPLNAGSWEWSDRTPVVSSFLDSTYSEDAARNCAVYKANKTLLPTDCASKHEWICKIPRGVVPTFPDWYEYDAPWFFYQHAEYLFHTHPAQWDDFAFLCGWLRLSKHGVNWWIGIKEGGASDPTHWHNGSPVIFQDWDGGREKRADNQSQRCAFISSVTGLWGTEDCSVSMPSICKREEMWVMEKKKPPLPHGTCPKGWLYFNHKCFQVWIPKDTRELKTWAGAQDFCVDKGGTLVSIESDLEQAFITVNLFGQTTNVWIGLKSDNHETWVNRKPVVYSNWSPSDVINIPNYNTSKMKKHVPLCALMLSSPNFHFTGKWYFDDCGKEGYGFVCEKMQDTPEYRANVSEIHSVPGTLEFGNRTYKIIRANMTWYTARRTCLMHGAELASIADNFQQAFLTVVLSRLGHAHWIGLSTTDNGLNFDWSDGTKSPFTYWKDEESTFLGDCVFADTSGRWHRTACESLLQGAICRVPTETKALEHPVLCPETSVPWIKFKGNCYSLSTVLDSRSFEDAHEFCKREGSNLLAIKDEAENLFLQEELRAFSSSVQMVWLNAQFDSNNETLRWFDGTPTDQSSWGVQKPTVDPFQPRPCVALRILEGVWQFTPCEDQNGFICKMKADVPAVMEHPGKGRNHSIVPLAVSLTLMAILAFVVLCFWIYKQNSGFFQRLTGSRGLYYPTLSFSTAQLEENIHISDLEKNGQ